jgi:carbamoyl-phosphate synthase small subunit
MRDRPHISSFPLLAGIFALSACATPARMHTEASPGPQDSFYLFEKFVGAMR